MAGPVLCVDTSSRSASVAVCVDRVLAEISWQAGRSHTTQLLPSIERVLVLAGTDKQELVGIAVAAGPGSYSGLRVGISTVLGMGLSLHIPVVQVSTLDIMAASIADRGLVRVAVEVGRGRYATALYREGASLSGSAQQFESADLARLGQMALEEGALLVADLSAEERNVVVSGCSNLRLALSAAALRRASFMAPLARVLLDRALPDAIPTVAPIYLS